MNRTSLLINIQESIYTTKPLSVVSFLDSDDLFCQGVNKLKFNSIVLGTISVNGVGNGWRQTENVFTSVLMLNIVFLTSITLIS
jgi:hypothetical protein